MLREWECRWQTAGLVGWPAQAGAEGVEVLAAFARLLPGPEQVTPERLSGLDLCPQPLRADHELAALLVGVRSQGSDLEICGCDLHPADRRAGEALDLEI